MIGANDARHIRQLLRHLAENPATEETIVFFADNSGMLQSCTAILSRYHGGNREVREWLDKECASKGVSPTFLLQEAARIHQLFGADERENIDHYLVLGLSAASASPENIKRAYRRLCAQYHPDTSSDPGPEATEKFIAINRAYHALMEEAPEAESNPAGTTATSWHHGRQLKEAPRDISKKLVLAGILALVAVGASMFLAHLYSRQAMLTALRNRSVAFVPPPERSAPKRDMAAPLTLHERLRLGEVALPEEPSAPDGTPPLPEPLATEDSAASPDLTYEKIKMSPSVPLVAEVSAPFSATTSGADKALTDGPAIEVGTAEPTIVRNEEKPVVLLPAGQHKVKAETAVTTIPPPPLPAEIVEQSKKASAVVAPASPAVDNNLTINTLPIQESRPASTSQQGLDAFLTAYEEKPVVLLPADQHKVKVVTAVTTIPPTSLPVRIEEPSKKAPTIAAPASPAVDSSLTVNTLPKQESRPASTLQPRLDAFLAAYCRAYGAQNLEAFANFFDLAAIENGKPFLELRDTYRHLFASTRERSLIISSRQWEKTGDNIRLQGRFTITLIYDNGETVNRDGAMEFFLADGRDGLLIKAMNYSIEDHSKKTETATTAAPSAVGKKLSDHTLPKQESLPASTLQQRLDVFLAAYCNAYGARNLEAFVRFFDLAAIENGMPFLELRDTYRHLFATTKERTLTISSRQWKNEGGDIRLHGQFTITLLYNNGETVHGAGDMDFILANGQGDLKIKAMNYSFD